MRILFMGTPDFAVPSLQMLIDSRHDVVGVLTQPDKPQGRRQILTPPPVKTLALAHDLPVHQPETLKNGAIQSILDDEELSALVIAPSDAYSLNDVLEQVYEKSIPVISYDQLIMDTDKVNYYVTFNTRKAGKMVGDSIIKKMDLEKAREEKKTLTIEFLMGSPDDRDALFFYNGVMEKLQEYFVPEETPQRMIWRRSFLRIIQRVRRILSAQVLTTLHLGLWMPWRMQDMCLERMTGL